MYVCTYIYIYIYIHTYIPIHPYHYIPTHLDTHLSTRSRSFRDQVQAAVGVAPQGFLCFQTLGSPTSSCLPKPRTGLQTRSGQTVCLFSKRAAHIMRLALAICCLMRTCCRKYHNLPRMLYIRLAVGLVGVDCFAILQTGVCVCVCV